MSDTNSSNILAGDELKKAVANWRQNKKTIVATNGCFDILHIGHLHLLNKAKEFGDLLIVGVNSDKSVSNLKGPQRPVVTQQERAAIIASLKAVDCVCIFDESTAVNLLDLIKPDVYVKGGDYNLANLPEAQTVLSAGGRVEFIPLAPRKSTTSLIDKIKALS